MLTLILALTFFASMAGGLAPAVEGLLERLGMERVVSFRSGVLIAVALANVLPESWSQARLPGIAAAAAALLLGWRLHHDHSEVHEGHELTHPHIHPTPHLPTAVAALFIHSLLDGLNLGATVAVGAPALLAIGAATSLHKVADGFTLASLFRHSGSPPSGERALLVAVSLATPVGALLGRAGALRLGPIPTAILLGFAGGSFLFVGASQIIPHLNRKRDAQCAVAFLAGASVMLAIERMVG